MGKVHVKTCSVKDFRFDPCPFFKSQHALPVKSSTDLSISFNPSGGEVTTDDLKEYVKDHYNLYLKQYLHYYVSLRDF